MERRINLGTSRVVERPVVVCQPMWDFVMLGNPGGLHIATSLHLDGLMQATIGWVRSSKRLCCCEVACMNKLQR